MKVFLAVPVFTKDPKELEVRKKDTKKWLDEVAEPELKKRYRCNRFYRRTLAPGATFTLRQDDRPMESLDLVSVTYPDGEKAIVPKGQLIRLEIFRALEEIDDPRDRDNAFFVMIDGSGAFKLENLFDLLNRLQATPPTPRADVVLGIRPQEDTGMAPWRRGVELFEESLLFAVLGPQIKAQLNSEVLPDSQAGCWALCMGALKRLPLTARNYGLEFDLLASALDNKVPLDFVGPLKMGPRTDSQFQLRSALYKLQFLMHKLGLSSGDILKHLDQYMEGPTKGTQHELRADYVANVRSILRSD